MNIRSHRTTIWRRKWRKANPAKAKEVDRKRALARYGLTLEKYQDILDSQKGLCAMCELPPDSKVFVVDHDHDTGVIRGLVHNLCNRALGFLKEDPEIFEKAALYLRNNRNNRARKVA